MNARTRPFASTALFAHLILIVGVFACSTSVLFIKAMHLPVPLIVSHRLIISAAFLTPLYLFIQRRSGVKVSTTFGRAVPGAVLLVAHFLTWVAAAQMTTAANATLIVNLMPVTMPFILLITTGERVSLPGIGGTILSLGGVLVLALKGFRPDPHTFAGDALCFVSMLIFSLYLIVARRGRGKEAADQSNIWLYVVPLYWIAGLLCLAIAVVWLKPPWFDLPRREWILLVGLALVPTVVGHSSLNYAMQVLNGQIVSIFNLGQFIFAGIIAFFLFREVPTVRFYIASLLIVVGAMIIVRTEPPAAVPEELPD